MTRECSSLTKRLGSLFKPIGAPLRTSLIRLTSSSRLQSHNNSLKRQKPRTFLQRVSIACYTERCISHDRFCLSDRLTVRPSVYRPSVTRRYHAKTTPATIMRSSLEDSPMTLVSSWLTSPQNSKGNMGSEGAE